MVVAIHQAGRDRKVDELLLIENLTRGRVGMIRCTGVGDADYVFGPGGRSMFGLT